MSSQHNRNPHDNRGGEAANNDDQHHPPVPRASTHGPQLPPSFGATYPTLYQHAPPIENSPANYPTAHQYAPMQHPPQPHFPNPHNSAPAPAPAPAPVPAPVPAPAPIPRYTNYKRELFCWLANGAQGLGYNSYDWTRNSFASRLAREIASLERMDLTETQSQRLAGF
ncbi:hypothetical protein PFICI_01269 [Pestalotiopsis fici W106-1]|uniref:Uncharacterized protein n=1 Tax=Pestalotiopsis fici (strain W106-1 / CGMCC3.15140) TaxID=1229662 RepID=W3XQA7_PESFW|nr:uncharacterized protein PFICI_01269 [Pestalotiopsis fici W106-1]ETS87441.1 hypothetical protein PFICI_01269 [Pestalotiopsis fici W106-1]